MTSDQSIPEHSMSRRDALRKGAVIGALVWVPPLVQSVNMTAAHADSPSSPPAVQGEKLAKNSGAALPRTGSDLDLGTTAVVATGLVAAGAATLAVSKRNERRAADGGQEEPTG